MTSKEFVEALFQEKEKLLKSYFDQREETEINAFISQLNLDESKRQVLRKMIDSVLMEAFYTMLLGLDGKDRQEDYKLFDKDGNELTGGNIEAYAREYFQKSIEGEVNLENNAIKENAVAKAEAIRKEIEDFKEFFLPEKPSAIEREENSAKYIPVIMTLVILILIAFYFLFKMIND